MYDCLYRAWLQDFDRTTDLIKWLLARPHQRLDGYGHYASTLT